VKKTRPGEAERKRTEFPGKEGAGLRQNLDHEPGDEGKFGGPGSEVKETRVIET